MNIIIGIIFTFEYLVTQAYSQLLSCYNPISTCFNLTTCENLLFQQHKHTTCLKNIPTFQLNCVNNQSTETKDLCWLYSKYITSIKCANMGLDDSGNVIWNCDGNLPPNVTLKSSIVNCEKCNSSTNNLKIFGSCGIYYSLVLTKTNLSSQTHSFNNTNTKFVFNYKNKKLIVVVVILSIIAFGIGVMLYKFCSSIDARRNKRRNRPRIYTSSIKSPDDSNIVFSEASPLIQTKNNDVKPTEPLVPPIQTYVPFVNYGSPYTNTNTHTNTHYNYEQYQSQSQTHSNQDLNNLNDYTTIKNLEKGDVEIAMLTSNESHKNNKNNKNNKHCGKLNASNTTTSTDLHTHTFTNISI